MIEVSGLAKRFGSTAALDGLTFAVPAGEIFGFVGPNGAGKTTCMRILAALTRADSGSASIGGVDVATHPERARERIGFMPDFFGIYDHMTAGEYLAFYASCYRIPRRRVDGIVTDLLDLIGLPDKRHAPVDGLSRGMKQRLCLARALVHDPDVLLLDEPASGLDPRARVEMRELLRELRAMGKTILVSSHILPELAEMCTVFGVIDSGRMVATGPLDSLLPDEGHRRVRVVVGGDPEAAEAVARGLPGVRSVERREQALEVEYAGGDPETAALARDLVAGGVALLSFTPEADDLEAVFLRTTRDGGAT